MFKVIFSIVGTCSLLFTGWYFLHDYSLCAVILLSCLLLFGWLFNFPEGKWMKQEELEHERDRLSKLPIDHIQPNFFKDIKAKDLVHKLPYVEKLVHIETRQHDTKELIEEVQEAIVKTFVPYCFIVISSVFAYIQSTKPEIKDIPFIKGYKAFSTITYLGVAIYYIAWNVAPVLLQKKKNRMLTH